MTHKNLPIDIEKLLDGKSVESNRLEFKEGWNPDAIYRSVCAFANDFEDMGGGYIVVGVQEKNGHAVRPVLGIDPKELTERQRNIYNIIRGGTINVPLNVPVNDTINDTTNVHNIALFFNVSEKTIKRDLYVLRDKQLVQYVGSKKTGHWEVRREE